jgi:DegV family protein with EDD domain
MDNFIIITDTGANLRPEIIDRYNISVVPIMYVIDGKEYDSLLATDETVQDIYNKMRDKTVVSTAAIGDGAYKEVFEKVLAAGKDILYIGFSSGLSSSYATGARVLKELEPNYPNQKLLYIDSLAATMGQGRLVIEAVKMREAGKTAEEVLAWLEQAVVKNRHIFTVESLQYLFRGGRISRTSSLIGTVLQIKPIMHVNATGHLEAIGKVIGRKRSLANMAERLAAQIENPEQQTVYIAHGDCLADAEYLAGQISQRIKVAGFDYTLLNAVIGAHSGPGTVAVFFGGK